MLILAVSVISFSRRQLKRADTLKVGRNGVGKVLIEEVVKFWLIYREKIRRHGSGVAKVPNSLKIRRLEVMFRV